MSAPKNYAISNESIGPLRNRDHSVTLRIGVIRLAPRDSSVK